LVGLRVGQSRLFERLLDSDIKADLLIYLHNNPNVTDTVDGYARRTHRDAAEIQRAMKDLEELGLVRRVETYAFNAGDDASFQERIFREIAASRHMAEPAPTPGREMVRTEIEVLDELVPGGIPESSSILLLTDPGAGREMIAAQFASETMKRGESALYITLDNFPDSIRGTVTGLLGEAGGKRGLLAFVDCYSKTVGVESHESFMADPENLSEVSMVLSNAIQRHNPKLIVLDSISTVIRKRQVRAALEFLHVLVAKARQSETLSLISMNRKAFHPAIIAAAQEIVDGVIEMKLEDEAGGIGRYLRILQMAGANHSSAWVAFEVGPAGIQPAKK
jgi:KaiC/GvpD/RAD55 family RecA-like ATPase